MLEAQTQLQSVTSTYLSNGVLGATCVALVIALVWVVRYAVGVQKDMAALQGQRVEDARNYAEKLLAQNTNYTAALTSATATIEAQQSVIEEMGKSFTALANGLRSPRGR